jgi:hypothetical protein
MEHNFSHENMDVRIQVIQWQSSTSQWRPDPSNPMHEPFL